jgi:hypothetical protein
MSEDANRSRKRAAFLFAIFSLFCACKASDNSVRDDTFKHFMASLDYSVHATKLAQTQFSSFQDDRFVKSTDFRRKALEEARKVNVDELNRWYSGLGDHFRDEFIRGTELMIAGYDRQNLGMCEQASLVINKWGTWYIANRNNIR